MAKDNDLFENDEFSPSDTAKKLFKGDVNIENDKDDEEWIDISRQKSEKVAEKPKRKSVRESKKAKEKEYEEKEEAKEDEEKEADEEMSDDEFKAIFMTDEKNADQYVNQESEEDKESEELKETKKQAKTESKKLAKTGAAEGKNGIKSEIKENDKKTRKAENSEKHLNMSEESEDTENDTEDKEESAEQEESVEENEEDYLEENKDSRHSKQNAKPSAVVWIIGIIIAAVLIAGTIYYVNQRAGAKTGNIVAKVNGEPITLQELDASYAQLNPAFKEQFSKEELLNQSLIPQRLLYQEAVKQGVAASPKEVDNAIEEIIANSPFPKDVIEKQLEAQNLTWDDIKKALGVQLSIQKLLNKTLGQQRPTEEEIRAYYDSNEKLFQTPEQLRASHILVCFNGTIGCKTNITETDAMQKINVLIEMINKTSFSSVAKNYSDDPSASLNSGDLGYFEKGQMVQEFEEVAFATEPGKVAGPVRTPYGLHLIKVTDKKEKGVVPYEQVKEQISELLTSQKQQKAFEEYVQGLRDKAEITIDYGTLHFSSKPKAMMTTGSVSKALQNEMDDEVDEQEASKEKETEQEIQKVQESDKHEADEGDKTVQISDFGKLEKTQMSDKEKCASSFGISNTTIIFYYAENCPPCQQMLPDVQKFNETRKVYMAEYFSESGKPVRECYPDAEDKGLPMLICAGTGTKKVGASSLSEIKTFASTCT